MKKRLELSLGTKRRNLALLFSPSVILLVIFFIGPMLLTLYYSFTDISLTGANAYATKFIGFRNFADAFSDPKFKTVFQNTIIFLVLSGIIGQQVFGFILAYLMQRKSKKLRKFVGFTLVVGWITPEVVAAFMFNALFADKGTLNLVFELFGASPVSWLFTFPLASVIIANIWKGSAYSMMMFQAALDNVSSDMIEAAKTDGASGFKILTKIILPTLKGTMATTFIVVTLSTLGAFGLIFAMTGGGPGIQSTTLSVYMYQKAFSSYQVGYGMAIALIILTVGILLSLIYVRSIKKKD